jgi:hypothetical protein
MKFSLVMCIILQLLTLSCIKRKTNLNGSVAKSFQPKVYQPLSKPDILRLIDKANEDWNNSETRIAWLSLASNFLNNVDVARYSVEALNQGNKATSLGLAGPSGSWSGSPARNSMTIDEQKLAIDAAENAGNLAMQQQKLMLDGNKASDDYSIRMNEFYKGMDAQNFDQQMKAATTQVEVEGHRIENFQKLVEAKKKIIENDILRSYANAYNSYVRSFHEYANAMVTVMRGAKKVSKQAAVLANSVLEYDKRVKRCASGEFKQQHIGLLRAMKNLELNDYSTISITHEKDIADRVRVVEDMPSGHECLEMGLIQANLDDFGESYGDAVYAQSNPMLRLFLNPTPRGSNAKRTVVACPAVDPHNDPLAISKHVNQVSEFATTIAGSANALNDVNESLTGETRPASNSTSPAGPPDESVGDNFDADDRVDFSAPLLAAASRSDGLALLVPFPVTPFQAVQLVQKNHLEFKVSPPSKPSYCELNPPQAEDKALLIEYVQAIRNFEALRVVKLKRSLELDGVQFDPRGRIILNNEPFNAGRTYTDDIGRANAIVRRGFFYAQQCGRITAAHAVQAGQTVGKSMLTLPAATELNLGQNKYSFFYPPHSLGDDATTLQNDLVKATRLCVDQALTSLAQSQMALGAASEYYKFFSEAANIRAPAAPIPYLPNPPPGTAIYSR